MGKTLDDFYNDLGARESGGNYKAVNTAGYIGKYQMGEAAMVDAGYYKRKPNNNYNNKWDGEFTGKDGIYSVEDFLNSPQAQENAQRIYKQKQWSYIKNFAQKYDGKVINEIPITQSGMLAATHLLGQGKLKEYLQSNGKYIPKDGYGTSIEEYLKKFAGYDVSGITGLKSDSTTTVQPNSARTATPQQPSKLFKIGVELRVDKDGNPIFTPQEIGEMTREEFEKNLPIIEQQLKDGLIKPENPQVDYSGYLNPLSGSGKIFSRESISQMSGDEYLANEPEIMAQLQSIGVPTENELYTASLRGGTIYVRPYTRSNGTEVRGYYRSV
ncbi:TPA: hypothetical protein IAD41_05585 [Candidatus Scatenecus faecavium]|uniref:Uncharacterized protein n=1 Tax=Candidatus Scatenecus faecavium TaxID=2840915 RepID=A0A9D1FW16_9BACT|nr:hypothetical protein [Candidatus Scatenecus faecavium]